MPPPWLGPPQVAGSGSEAQQLLNSLSVWFCSPCVEKDEQGPISEAWDVDPGLITKLKEQYKKERKGKKGVKSKSREAAAALLFLSVENDSFLSSTKEASTLRLSGLACFLLRLLHLLLLVLVSSCLCLCLPPHQASAVSIWPPCDCSCLGFSSFVEGFFLCPQSGASRMFPLSVLHQYLHPHPSPS